MSIPAVTVAAVSSQWANCNSRIMCSSDRCVFMVRASRCSSVAPSCVMYRITSSVWVLASCGEEERIRQINPLSYCETQILLVTWQNGDMKTCPSDLWMSSSHPAAAFQQLSDDTNSAWLWHMNVENDEGALWYDIIGEQQSCVWDGSWHLNKKSSMSEFLYFPA